MTPLSLGLWPKTAAQQSADVEYNAKLDATARASPAAKEQAHIDSLREDTEGTTAAHLFTNEPLLIRQLLWFIMFAR